jgi:membrane associated rhomboid family serine protease
MLKEIARAHYRAIWFLYVIWAAFAIQVCCALLGIDLPHIFGLIPRSLFGLFGIVCMPLLHGGLPHIIMNSVGLFMVLVPLYLAFQDEAHMPETILKITLISGVLVWCFGRGTSPEGHLMTHIGASALSYGLTFYMLMAGLVFKNPFLIIVSFANLFWTGSSLIAGLSPTQVGISWEGHLCGAIAGILVAISQKKQMGTKLLQKT